MRLARWNLSPSTGRGDVDAKLQGLGKLAESGDAAQDVVKGWVTVELNELSGFLCPLILNPSRYED